MENQPFKTLSIRVEPGLLEAFRPVAQGAGRSVPGKIRAYMRRAASLYDALEAKRRLAQGEGNTAVQREMQLYLTGMLETEAVTERAVALGLWLAEHKEAGEKLLGLAACSARECAGMIRQFRLDGQEELALLAAYKQWRLEG